RTSASIPRHARPWPASRSSPAPSWSRSAGSTRAPGRCFRTCWAAVRCSPSAPSRRASGGAVSARRVTARRRLQTSVRLSRVDRAFARLEVLATPLRGLKHLVVRRPEPAGMYAPFLAEPPHVVGLRLAGVEAAVRADALAVRYLGAAVGAVGHAGERRPRRPPAPPAGSRRRAGGEGR